MPPSNNVITSFLSTLIGQPHFGAEGPRNASIVTRRTFPYVGGAAGHETSGNSDLPCLSVGFDKALGTGIVRRLLPHAPKDHVI